ncbi:hypothetical protein [Demequina sp. NBRC 110053]|uniref:hypothetical protein n=1 Tax=Demequina sp. NBRC 110053 TaxID=1570342 RepID=UPI000A06B82A|nr:hypothetical protein [Demequina sp. NBRC 110053]
MKRVSVVGSSGSGKTTVARQLAEALGIPHTEMDALHWGADWTPTDDELLAERVRAVAAADSWVIDGNYHSKIGPVVWERADAVVWLDVPRHRALWRGVTRTVRRAATREELWNGNREHWSGLAFWRGDESIIWWVWTSHRRTRQRYAAAIDDPRWAHLKFHRLRSRRDVARFLAAARPSL